MAQPKLIPSYSHQEYQQWKGDWELWDGIPVSMSPSPGKAHQRAARKLSFLLQQALDRAGCEHCELFYEIDWVISDKMVVRPDILITCGDADSVFVESCPILVAEVLSPSSLERDLIYKKALYLEQGVRYYLVLEPEDFKLTVFQWAEGHYEETEKAHTSSFDLKSCQISLEI